MDGSCTVGRLFQFLSLFSTSCLIYLCVPGAAAASSPFVGIDSATPARHSVHCREWPGTEGNKNKVVEIKNGSLLLVWTREFAQDLSETNLILGL